METVERKIDFKCEHCSKVFKRKAGLAQHLITHDTGAAVNCEKCAKPYKNQKRLKIHMANCHSNKAPISCNICHKTLSTKNTLQAHHKKFHSSTTRPRIPCPSPPCDKTYFDKIAITDHVRREHNENPTKFPCTLCGKEFKMKAHLNSHIAFHTTEKPYKCLTCGRRFAQTSNFKSHQRVHMERSQREVHRCHLCDRILISKRNLNDHIRNVHDNVKNYSCKNCDMKFPTRNHLGRHVDSKHPSRETPLHSCNLCEYKSHSRCNFQRHLQRHDPCEKKYSCYFCGKKFRDFSRLRGHIWIHTLEM